MVRSAPKSHGPEIRGRNYRRYVKTTHDETAVQPVVFIRRPGRVWTIITTNVNPRAYIFIRPNAIIGLLTVLLSALKIGDYDERRACRRLYRIVIVPGVTRSRGTRRLTRFTLRRILTIERYRYPPRSTISGRWSVSPRRFV